jgi:hypothetical protein
MRTVIVAVFILLFGAFALFSSISNPRLKALQGSDVLQLVALGLCVGSGITLLIRHFFG